MDHPPKGITLPITTTGTISDPPESPDCHVDIMFLCKSHDVFCKGLHEFTIIVRAHIGSFCAKLSEVFYDTTQ